MASFDKSIPVHTIIAGKLRRYHHLSVFRQLLWPSLVIKNVKDMFLVIAGFFQSFFKLVVWRPDVVFTKGGYVCLPVGIAANLLGIPIVVHDSDAHPGLTNRILAKWASAIATGAPLEYYDYPAKISRYVGIPISSDYHVFSSSDRKKAKEGWGINPYRPLIVVTGGGLGATRINDTVVRVLDDLMALGSVVLVSGSGQYEELKAKTPSNGQDFQLLPFVAKGFASLLGGADVVITRAGATTILELAALGKPTILVPNAKLTGGHQVKNAKVYMDAGAVMLVDEDEMLARPEILVDAVKKIVTDKKLAKSLSDNFIPFARPDAAKNVAEMILKTANRR